MSEYIYAYHGGKMPDNPEEGAKLMARWGSWVEGIGAAMINPGNPVGMSHTVSASGVVENGGSNPLSGYSVVRADSLNAAIEMAKDCPHLDHGTIEVAEIMEM
jgi:YCII-related domain-containing protein